ncbi:hypothetical protein Q4S45_08180 [Massilia sp. R2A-15]|uniref:hypothetical protein n=1 Tax=Massilia sp. R2A-15 TaxID=3064278 RepID=UPI0027339FAD|nr:hypothetical protein [Massilia sp. R2A-15]WLI91082.1 hypothetical protein Q4S45_08180 [Massilia sp. R2A-15]
MVPNRPTLLATMMLMALFSGCTDRDRELARRTGDGSDTFKYQPPAGSTPPPPKKEVDKPPARNGADTFHYKPDPRGFPTAPKPAGK